MVDIRRVEFGGARSEEGALGFWLIGRWLYHIGLLDSREWRWA
jgi:hypothetical protein